MINVVMVGYGYWGKIIRKYLEEDDRISLCKIYAPSCANENIFTNNIEDLFNIDIDWVVIATPIDTHTEISKQFLKRGINVFCEKPISKSENDVAELIDLANINNCIIETNYIYLDSLSINTMKSKLNDIGDILSVSGEISQFGNFYKEDGVVEILGSHLFSVILELFGYEYREVIAKNVVIDENKNSLLNFTTIKYPTFDVDLRFGLTDILKKRELTIQGTKGSLYFNMLDKKPLRMRFYKDTRMEYVDEEFCFDESNNLKNTMNRIVELTNKQRNSNAELSQQVSNLIERVKKNEIR